MIPPWAKNQLGSFEFFYLKSGAAMKLNSATIHCFNKTNLLFKVQDYCSSKMFEVRIKVRVNLKMKGEYIKVYSKQIIQLELHNFGGIAFHPTYDPKK